MRMLKDVRGLREVIYVNGGRALLSRDSGHEFRLWDLAAFQRGRTLSEQECEAAKLLFLPGGERFLQVQGYWPAGPDFPLEAPDPPRPLPRIPARERCRNLAFGPNGRTILWLDWRAKHQDPDRLTLRDLDGRRRHFFLYPYSHSFSAPSFSPDGVLLAAAAPGHAAFVWRVEADGEPVTLPHTDVVAHTAFGPDHRLLATAAGRTVRLWDMHTYQCVHRFRAFVRSVNCIAFSPDGRLLAAASSESRVRLWEAATGREVADLRWRIGVIGGLAFSPDGSTAAVAGSRRSMVVWDVDG